MPGPRPSAALYSVDPAKAQCSPAPPGRPRLGIVCVCVLGVCCVLCRSICFLLSGRLSFGIRLLLHSVVLSVAVLPFSGSVPIAHVVRCSPSRIRLRCALCFVLFRSPAGSRLQMLAVRFRSSLHTTPHPFITHHTTQYPHTSYTTNHAYQPFSLPPTTTHSCPHKFGMVYSLLYASDALSVLDQVYPIFPKL
jgi:hypothetical protein